MNKYNKNELSFIKQYTRLQNMQNIKDVNASKTKCPMRALMKMIMKLHIQLPLGILACIQTNSPLPDLMYSGIL